MFCVEVGGRECETELESRLRLSLELVTTGRAVTGNVVHVAFSKKNLDVLTTTRYQVRDNVLTPEEE